MNAVIGDEYALAIELGVAVKGSTRLGIGVGGTVVAVICCFTPALVILLGVAGLSAWLVWIDYILLPALALFAGFTVYAFIRWSCARSRIEEAADG